MTETEVLGLFERCSNAGRWGDADERGTLNYITGEVVRAALSTVKRGAVVSIGKDVPTRSGAIPPPAMHLMTSVGLGGISAQDALSVVTHGFANTHLDALGHTFFEGKIYNARMAADHVRQEGLTFGAVTAMAAGIVTRGVLLDVADVRGVDFLEAGDGVSASDLEAAAAKAGIRIRSGDAVLIRTGHDARIAQRGAEPDDFREGVLPDVLPWLHEHEIALYGADCIERIPSGYPSVPLPLHQVGHVAMGLAILDIPDMEAVTAACRTYGVNDFLLIISPLRVPGGTGSLVNPLIVF